MASASGLEWPSNVLLTNMAPRAKPNTLSTSETHSRHLENTTRECTTSSVYCPEAKFINIQFRRGF
jgi:hypothetical protein